jgi:uncharacterized membrane protein
MYILKKINHYFDKLEDNIRGALSHVPIIYAVFGGIIVVMFWRGVWESIDILWKSDNEFFRWFFYPPISLVFSIIILLMIGLMVSTFIGHRIIMSGLKNEKKVEEMAEEMIKEEEITLAHVMTEIKKIRSDIENKK